MRLLRHPAPVLVIAGLLLGACGFRPMYGTASMSAETAQLLQGVSVAPMKGQLGLSFRNDLIDAMSAGRTATDPAYRLEADILRNEFSSLVQTDSSITRYSVVVETPFKLIEIKTSKVVLSETSRVLTSYDVPTSEYAAVVARTDAETRAAQQAARDIALRVGSFLESHPAAGVAPAPP